MPPFGGNPNSEARIRNKAPNPKFKCSKRNVQDQDIDQTASHPEQKGTGYGDRDLCFSHWDI
jgi:hypothetical protein